MIYCLKFLHTIKLDKETWMISPPSSTVKFYETTTEIGEVEPYAVISHQELESIIGRFISWAAIIATHPEVADIFGESNTVHIRLATDLRLGIKNSFRDGTYPNVVLPRRKFTTVITVSRISLRMEQELHQLFEKEMWD
jgi:hypothetical protein